MTKEYDQNNRPYTTSAQWRTYESPSQSVDDFIKFIAKYPGVKEAETPRQVLNALQEGRTLSSAQMKSFFGTGNPQAVIQSLRFKGFPIYLNTVTDTKGRSRNVYRLGTASRAVIAAGYQALASS